MSDRDDEQKDKIQEFFAEHGNWIVAGVVLVAVLLKMYVFK